MSSIILNQLINSNVIEMPTITFSLNQLINPNVIEMPTITLNQLINSNVIEWKTNWIFLEILTCIEQNFADFKTSYTLRNKVFDYLTGDFAFFYKRPEILMTIRRLFFTYVRWWRSEENGNLFYASFDKKQAELEKILFENCSEFNEELVYQLIQNGYLNQKSQKICLSYLKEKFKKNSLIFIEVLCRACVKGDVQIVEFLINNRFILGIDPNKTDSCFRFTPLEWACRGGHKHVVGFLLFDRKKIGVNIDVEIWNRSAFYPACISGQIEIVRLLLENKKAVEVEDLNPGNKYGKELLEILGGDIVGFAPVIELLLFYDSKGVYPIDFDVETFKVIFFNSYENFEKNDDFPKILTYLLENKKLAIFLNFLRNTHFSLEKGHDAVNQFIIDLLMKHLEILLENPMKLVDVMCIYHILSKLTKKDRCLMRLCKSKICSKADFYTNFFKGKYEELIKMRKLSPGKLAEEIQDLRPPVFKIYKNFLQEAFEEKTSDSEKISDTLLEFSDFLINFNKLYMEITEEIFQNKSKNQPFSIDDQLIKYKSDDVFAILGDMQIIDIQSFFSVEPKLLWDRGLFCGIDLEAIGIDPSIELFIEECEKHCNKENLEKLSQSLTEKIKFIQIIDLKDCDDTLKILKEPITTSLFENKNKKKIDDLRAALRWIKILQLQTFLSQPKFLQIPKNSSLSSYKEKFNLSTETFYLVGDQLSK